MKAVKTTFIGALLGALASVATFVLGFACDFLSCACAIITCDFSSSSDATSGIARNFGSIFLFCVIGGAVIGLIYGLYKMKEEADENDAKRLAEQAEADRIQRKKWASEMWQHASKIEQSCKSNAESMKSPIVSSTYKADTTMGLIMAELTNVAELQGEIVGMASDTKKEGE